MKEKKGRTVRSAKNSKQAAFTPKWVLEEIYSRFGGDAKDWFDPCPLNPEFDGRAQLY